jgi:hypothetical protein
MMQPATFEIVELHTDSLSNLRTTEGIPNRKMKSTNGCAGNDVLVRHQSRHVSLPVLGKAVEESRASTNAAWRKVAFETDCAMGQLFSNGQILKSLSHVSLS